MEAGYDTILKLLEMAINVSSQNPIAMIISVIMLFGSYGFIRYQLKKAQDRKIEEDRQRDRSTNIDDLEEDASRSNAEIRRRLEERGK